MRHSFGIVACPRGHSARRRAAWRWALWAMAIVFTPVLAMGAYQPAFVPTTFLSNSAKTIVASVTGSITSGHLATFADNVGTIQDGGAAPTGTVSSVTCGTGLSGGTFTTSGTCSLANIVPTIFTGSSPLTLGSTNNLEEIIEMGTPAALTINLPASPADGTYQCVKDGLKNFATDNATIKTTDSSTIDKVAGATGYVMNQNGQQNCFYYSASKTNWYIF